ncbi:unnamed protein product [Effrenium voratum]|nr:unnamed protein product [Effrenium voratum]
MRNARSPSSSPQGHLPECLGRCMATPTWTSGEFCHGWAAGDFSLQSATFGVPLSREAVFPRRKLFFAGLALWSFGDPRESILQYYQGSNALEFCVGHDTFHRQERKYSEENELHRFDGNAPCATLADTFAFAGPWQEGPPEGISGDLILAAVHSFLLLQEPRWALDPDPTLAGAYETFRRARVEEMLHVASEGRLRPGQFQSLQTSQLTAPFGEAVHHLLQAALALEPAGSCDLVLRLRPIRQEASSSLGYVASPSAVSMREQILEAGGRLLRFDVPSCVCRMRLGSLGLQWVAEDARS